MSNNFPSINREAASRLALSMYANEPCRICGWLLSDEDINDAVYAGYSKGNKSRAAHGQCWRSNKPKEEWAYPEDEA